MTLKPVSLFLCLSLMLLGLASSAFAEPCTEENSQSPYCRGVKAFFYAKYKMDLGVGAGVKLLSVSCDLKRVNRQCRSYSLLETSSAKLTEMKEGCLSMGGRFIDKKCSSIEASSSCNNVVRNYHSPDVIYSTTFYLPENKAHIEADINERKYVCGTLGGSFKVVNLDR